MEIELWRIYMEENLKQLLFKDLCARLPYGVIVEYKSQESKGDVELGPGNIGYILQLGHGWWKECKPYLRPMSSMTDEESKEFALLQTDFYVDGFLYPIAAINMVNWLNAHHFDFRNLIERGLAIDCTNLNIY